MAAATAAFLADHASPAENLALPESALAIVEAARDREQWSVEFSQFFNCPPRPTSSDVDTAAALVGLRRPTSKAKLLSKGTWITAASPADLVIFKPAASSVPILSVSVIGVVHEEHYVSDLHFSWPQVSCGAQCPTMGSRVVFLSYSDSSTKIQKFAIRFATSCDAEAFLNFVKECSRETRTDVMHETSSLSHGLQHRHETSSLSHGLQHRPCNRMIDTDTSYDEHMKTNVAELPALSFYNEEQSSCPNQLMPAKNNAHIRSGLPPSFTELISNCSDIIKESKPAIEAKLQPQERESMSSSSQERCFSQVNDISKPKDSIANSDIQTRIAKYMSDPNFHEMLYNLENFVHELGGDLTVE